MWLFSQRCIIHLPLGCIILCRCSVCQTGCQRVEMLRMSDAIARSAARVGNQTKAFTHAGEFANVDRV